MRLHSVCISVSASLSVTLSTDQRFWEHRSHPALTDEETRHVREREKERGEAAVWPVRMRRVSPAWECASPCSYEGCKRVQTSEWWLKRATLQPKLRRVFIHGEVLICWVCPHRGRLERKGTGSALGGKPLKLFSVPTLRWANESWSNMLIYQNVFWFRYGVKKCCVSSEQQICF